MREVLLIHNISSGWAAPNDRAARRRHSDHLNSVAEDLLALHYDFDLGDELVMAEHGSVQDGRLVVADFGLARYCGECCRVEPHIPPHGSDVLAVPLTALRVPLAAAQSRTPKLT